MNKQPARLHKVEEPQPLIDFGNLVLLHPTIVVIGMSIAVIIACLLLFAVTGHSAVESGGMRNFFANGV